LIQKKTGLLRFLPSASEDANLVQKSYFFPTPPPVQGWSMLCDLTITRVSVLDLDKIALMVDPKIANWSSHTWATGNSDVVSLYTMSIRPIGRLNVRKRLAV